MLSVDGVIQEVVVDDYIPLNEHDAPIFSQPKTSETTCEIWTLILEKALAKIKGGYANIMGKCLFIQRAHQVRFLGL